jgi:hypothetical protein
MIGPGRYDDLCTLVRDKSNAAGAIVIVIDGTHGSGFSCQCGPDLLLALPDILESIARQIRRDQEK